MLVNSLLDTPLILQPGASDDEIEALWRETYTRAKMTQAFLDREIDVETYFDFMAQCGYEPAELMDTAEDNLDFAIKEGIELIR